MTLDTATFIHDWLVPFLAVVLAGCAAWITVKINTYINAHAAWLTTDEKSKIAALEKDAFTRAANWILQTVQTQGGKLQIHPDSWIMKQAVQIVLDHPAGVLGKPEDLGKQIVAMLPVGSVQIDATSSPQASVQTLAPIGAHT